jgi:hypothetical protein
MRLFDPPGAHDMRGVIVWALGRAALMGAAAALAAMVLHAAGVSL